MKNITNKQGFCPQCGADLTGCYNIHPEFSDGELFFTWTCEACKCSGEEHYLIEFDCHYNMTDEDGKDLEQPW